ncbi:MAG: FeoB-associated Cys-rich membrane protein [Clostridia bacterium]|nr:FeoB-associated Cys-rich membrane protein [Clostridia bacterium]
MVDFIIIAVVLVIVGAICVYLYRAKKRGQTCIGCPYAKQCAKKHGGCDCGKNKE